MILTTRGVLGHVVTVVGALKMTPADEEVRMKPTTALMLLA